MFGMSFTEILVIAIIAILFLGPEKLPNTMVQIAKFFKTFKKSINDAKSSIEQEMNIQELKEETRKYKESFEKTKNDVKKKLSLEELDEIKKTKQSVNETIESLKEDFGKPKKKKSEKKEKKDEDK
ncbi:MAG: twin-arginine translocase subunit TatB [Proteobacteria bacterium]|nr:MAG: twin-arginine translocase subunit TatB [Pseudomonadota bacterium]